MVAGSAAPHRKDVVAAYNIALHESDADHQLQSDCYCLLDYAHLILNTADADLKATYSMQAYQHYHHHNLPVFHPDTTATIPSPPTKPARPSTVREVKVNELVKPIKGDFIAERIRLLHSLCHIESYAVDLAWDIMLRFANTEDSVNESTHHTLLPLTYYQRWLRVAKEEATHYRIWRNRLLDLGSQYGALPAHDLLWTSASETSYSLMARASIVHALHEARGCDTSPRDVAKLSSAGDKLSAALLARIEEDEITHVGAGVQSLQEICQAANLDPVEQFQYFVRKHCKSASSLRPPFNTHARDAAGLTGEYYLPLVDQIGASKQVQTPMQKQTDEVSQVTVAAEKMTVNQLSNPEVNPQPNDQYVTTSFDATNATHCRDWKELGYEWLNAHQVLDEVDRPYLEQPRQNIIDHGGMIWLLYHSSDMQRAVGTVAIIPISENNEEFEICKLCVQPQHQGHGLAYRLIQTAISHARQHHAKRIILESNSKLSAALKLYVKCGFLPIAAKHSQKYASADVAYELILDNDQPSAVADAPHHTTIQELPATAKA